MDWKDVAGAVAKSAPMLGGLLGGPPGAAVGAVGAMIASALGVGGSADEVAQALTVNPDAAVKLKQIEADRQVELQKLVAQQAIAASQERTAQLQTEANDRDSARKASVAGGTMRPLFWLSLTLLLATLGTEGVVLFHGYPASVPDLVVGRVLGLMDSVAMMVLAFWYGSSSGSTHKTELLNRASPTP